MGQMNHSYLAKRYCCFKDHWGFLSQAPDFHNFQLMALVAPLLDVFRLEGSIPSPPY